MRNSGRSKTSILAHAARRKVRSPESETARLVDARRHFSSGVRSEEPHSFLSRGRKRLREHSRQFTALESFISSFPDVSLRGASDVAPGVRQTRPRPPRPHPHLREKVRKQKIASLPRNHPSRKGYSPEKPPERPQACAGGGPGDCPRIPDYHKAVSLLSRL